MTPSGMPPTTHTHCCASPSTFTPLSRCAAIMAQQQQQKQQKSIKLLFPFTFLLMEAHYSKPENNKSTLTPEVIEMYGLDALTRRMDDYDESTSEGFEIGVIPEDDDDDEQPLIEGGVIPWCWPQFRKFLGFDENMENYPLRGFRNVPRSSPDFKGIINNDDDWKALCDFFDEAYKYNADVKDKTEFTKICTVKAINEYSRGAKLFRAYFDVLWKRVKGNDWVNNTMRALNALPFQAYDQFYRVWPQKKPASDVTYNTT